MDRVSAHLEDVPGKWKHKALNAKHAPTEGESEALRRRVALLSAALRPGSPNLKAIQMMRLGWPAYGQTEQDIEAALLLYARATDRYPAWAVGIACNRFVEGRASIKWDDSQVPSPPQVAREAEAVVIPYAGEMARINTILGADVYREHDHSLVHDIERGRDMSKFVPILQRLGVDVSRYMNPNRPAGRVVSGRDTIADAERERALKDLERLSSDAPLTLSEDAKKIAGVA